MPRKTLQQEKFPCYAELWFASAEGINSLALPSLPQCQIYSGKAGKSNSKGKHGHSELIYFQQY